MDDILSSLDIQVSHKINEYLYELCEEQGYTVIMATNSLHFIKEKTRVLVIHDKRIIEARKQDIARIYSHDDTT